MEKKWPTHIKSHTGLFEVNLGELCGYRDMIFYLVRRNITTSYKQTVLGPLWILLSPLLSTVVYNIVFGNIAKMPTEGVPGFLFYLTGTVIWGLFAAVLNSNSTLFVTNANLFGKVYFPRLAVPLANILTKLVNTAVQFLLLFGVGVYYAAKGFSFQINASVLLLIPLLAQSCLLAAGIGLILSAATAKYRDLTGLIQVFVSLLMYATPVVYPLSLVPSGALGVIIRLNPMTAVMESARFVIFGVGEISLFWILAGLAETALILTLGIILFNRVEKNFIDTV